MADDLESRSSGRGTPGLGAGRYHRNGPTVSYVFDRPPLRDRTWGQLRKAGPTSPSYRRNKTIVATIPFGLHLISEFGLEPKYMGPAWTRGHACIPG